jgi:hypothetical protein
MPPKRKATEEDGNPPKKARLGAPEAPTRRSTRSKSKSKEPSTEPEESPSPTPDLKSRKFKKKKTEEEWEIVGDDSRDPVEINKPEPKRLTLTLREKKSGKPRPFTYSVKAEDFDWTSKKDIDALNKYRNNVFTTHGFPPKVSKYHWLPYEDAWLELVFQKLYDDKGHTSKPAKSKILEAFNNFFEGRTNLYDAKGHKVPARKARDNSSFSSHLKSPKLRALYDIVKDGMKDKSAGAWVPDITDAEIEAQMSERKGRGKTPAVVEALASPENNVAPAPKLKALPSTGQTKPRGAEILPPVPLTMDQLDAQGFKFSKLPKNNEQAIKQHREAENKRELDSSWNRMAMNDLDKRFEKRSKYNPAKATHPAGARKIWWRDFRPEVEAKMRKEVEEDWHKTSAREEGAAAVNGLLNAAILPPVGYTGDIRELLKKRELPDRELMVAETGAAARSKVHDHHDTFYKLDTDKEAAELEANEPEANESNTIKPKSNKPKANKPKVKQRNIYSDSSVTGDESVDEEI